MRVIVVGLGVQGKKRQHHAGKDFIGSVDTHNKDATYHHLPDVPLENYDAALVCLPDQPKYTVLRYLLEHGKHALVEKPLWTATDEQLLALERLARLKQVVCYVAYNHRFEPHFIRMKRLLDSGELGKLYTCRLFYGNGTARLVRESVWRDQGMGVVADLGSHLLDTLHFWFGTSSLDFNKVLIHPFENNAPDHALIVNQETNPQLMLEMSLLSWRNHFVCDLFAEKGSAHIDSLCKWGPSQFIHRLRVLPSGRPVEQRVTLVEDDPTWALEYAHFKQLVVNKGQTDLSSDLWIQRVLRRFEQSDLHEKKASDPVLPEQAGELLP